MEGTFMIAFSEILKYRKMIGGTIAYPSKTKIVQTRCVKINIAAVVKSLTFQIKHWLSFEPIQMKKRFKWDLFWENVLIKTVFSFYLKVINFKVLKLECFY